MRRGSSIIVKEAFACFLKENCASGLARSKRTAEPAARRTAFPRIYDPTGDYDAAVAESPVCARDPDINETILIDGGRYVARSYRAAGYLAMWLVAVGIVQFYDSSGRMLGTINLFELLGPKRVAA